MIEDPHEAAEQALHLAERGIESICIHGDSDGAVEIAREVRYYLEREHNWKIQSPFDTKKLLGYQGFKEVIDTEGFTDTTGNEDEDQVKKIQDTFQSQW